MTIICSLLLKMIEKDYFTLRYEQLRTKSAKNA